MVVPGRAVFGEIQDKLVTVGTVTGHQDCGNRDGDKKSEHAEEGAKGQERK